MYATFQHWRQGGRRQSRRLLLLVGAFAIAPLSAQAQRPLAVQGGIGVSSTGYERELYEKFNLPSRSWGFHGTFAPRLYGYFEVVAEIGWEFWTKACLDPSDCDDDTNQTSALFASLGAGLATPVLFVNDPSGRVGFGLTITGGQEWTSVGLSENKCLNCTIEDLDADGGLWFEPGLDLHTDSDVVIGFRYRRYESSSDLTSRITVRIIHQAR